VAYIVSDKPSAVNFLLTLRSSFPVPTIVTTEISLVQKGNGQQINTIAQQIEVPPSSTICQAPQPLFGRTLDEVMRMSPKELGALKQAGLWLSVIQATPVQPTVPLEIPPGTPPCQAVIQVKVMGQDGTVLDQAVSTPFQIMESSPKAPLIRVQMEPLTREGSAMAGETISVKCRAVGTFDGPTPLAASWWVGAEATEGPRWTAESVGEERTFSLRTPQMPAGGQPQEVQLLWNDAAGNIVGRESIEVRPRPAIDIDLSPDPLAEWPWVRASYRVTPKPLAQSDLVWYISGIQAYAQYGEEGAPQSNPGGGYVDVLIPPGLARNLMVGGVHDFSVNYVEQDHVLASTTRQIGITRPQTLDPSDMLARYLDGLGRMSSKRGATAPPVSKEGGGLPFLIGLVGNIPLYHGARVDLGPDEALEYIVRTKWRGGGEPPPSVTVHSKIQGMDSLTLMEDRQEVAVGSGRAQAGPFRWTIPPNIPGEIRLSIAICLNDASVREKTYVLRLSKNG